MATGPNATWKRVRTMPAKGLEKGRGKGKEKERVRVREREGEVERVGVKLADKGRGKLS